MKCSDPNCCYDQCKGHQHVKPIDYTHEHEQVRSRLTHKNVEIEQCPLPAAGDPSKGGLVPANPFASLAQAGYMHSHPEILGASRLKEWDNATRGKHLPKHVKK
jgi:hypothetical protein